MTTLKLDAYIPSKGEYEKYFDKFRAFMSADVSEKVKKQDDFYDYANYEGKGWYPLRSPWSGSGFVKVGIYAGDISGNLSWGDYQSGRDGVLRVAFKVIYNPNSSLVKGCRTEKRTTLVYDRTEKKILM